MSTRENVYSLSSCYRLLAAITWWNHSGGCYSKKIPCDCFDPQRLGMVTYSLREWNWLILPLLNHFTITLLSFQGIKMEGMFITHLSKIVARSTFFLLPANKLTSANCSLSAPEEKVTFKCFLSFYLSVWRTFATNWQYNCNCNVITDFSKVSGYIKMACAIETLPMKKIK